MCELLVGCLGKIGQEAIGAAMESVAQDGSTRLGRRRAIALKKRGPFSNFLPTQCRVLANTISVYLREFKTN